MTPIPLLMWLGCTPPTLEHIPVGHWAVRNKNGAWFLRHPLWQLSEADLRLINYGRP